MTLALYSNGTLHRIVLSEQSYRRLRRGESSAEEIGAIARDNDVDPALLDEYVRTLGDTEKAVREIDGACDYTDHF